MKNHHITKPKAHILGALTTVLVPLFASVAHAQYTPVWSDGFAVTAASLDVNFEHASRQSGVLSPVNYAQSPAGADFRHQLDNFPDQLLLAGDGGAIGMVSPNYNFKNPVGAGIPAKVSFQLQMNGYAGSAYTTAGFSLGSSSTLTGAQDAASHFGIRFTRDDLFGAGGVIQFFDGAGQVGVNYAFPGGIDPGAAIFEVSVTFSDPSDGNPWNGVGSSDISVFVNGALVGSYSKGGGGYTDNFMTLESGFGANAGANPGDPAVIGLGINVFDEWVVATIPAPATAVWNDGYAVSAVSTDIDFEYTTRQSGVLSPISYAQNPAPADPLAWHHQVGNSAFLSRLLLASDAGTTAMVSPNYNFKNLVGGGIPAQVSFQLQLNADNLSAYTTAGFSLGGGSTLTAVGSASSFGIRFTRDALFGAGNVIQLFDGNTQVGPNYSFPGGIDPGAASFGVTLDIADPSDGNPWNGVGSTVTSVFVNGTFVASYSKGSGGYTNNFMTLESGFGANAGANPGDPAVIGLAINVFDELTVATRQTTSTYSSWISNPAFGLVPADQGFDLDPDGDGIDNGTEAWFGTNPGLFNAGVTTPTKSGNVSTFTHPQNASPLSDVSGYYEWTSNLNNWYLTGTGPGVGPTVTFSSVTSGGTTTVTATASAPMEKQFLRVGSVNTAP